MAGLVAERLHDLFIRRNIPLQELQLRGSQVEGNAYGNLFIDTSPLIAKIKVGPETDPALLQLFLQPLEPRGHALTDIQFQVADSHRQKSLIVYLIHHSVSGESHRKIRWRTFVLYWGNISRRASG